MSDIPSRLFLLFVYGTLKRGGCRHAALADQTLLGEARTRPIYALHHLGAYPGLKNAPDGGQVVYGELYAVEETRRTRLDEIEGSPTWFCLGPVELEGITEPAWAYFAVRETGQRIESGVWDNH